MSHLRRCWSCGNVAEHSDSIVPYVLCKVCGSQDTRRLQQPGIEILKIRQAAETAIYNLRGNAKELHTIASLALTALYECTNTKEEKK